MSVRFAMSVKPCWSRDCWPTHELLRRVFHATHVYCLFLCRNRWRLRSSTHVTILERIVLQHIAGLKFPCLSLMTSGSSGSASSFPHHLWAGPALPFNAWHSRLCVARLLHSSLFWSARSDNRLTRCDIIWQ